MSSLELINMKVKSFIVFNKIFEDKVMKSFINMIDVKESSTIEKIEKYSSFVRELFEKNESFSEYIWQLIVFDENIYICKLSNKEDVLRC